MNFEHAYTTDTSVKTFKIIERFSQPTNLKGRSFYAANPKTLTEAKTLLDSLPPTELLTISILSGVSSASNYALETPHEVLLLSQLGYRQTFQHIPKAHVQIRQDYRTNCLWNDDKIIASAYPGRILLEETKNHIHRGLVFSLLPNLTRTHQPHIKAVGFWLDNDPDDILVPTEPTGWDISYQGGKAYFLYPEKGIAPQGCCRGISLTKLAQQFSQYPKFKETIQQKEKLWNALNLAFQKEEITLPA